MDMPALVLLSEIHLYPPSQVGEQAVMLAELEKIGVPVSETIVIPTEKLHQLSIDTKLADKLKHALAQSRWSSDHNGHQAIHSQLTAAIQHLELPEWFTRPILKWYHQHQGFVRVTNSMINSPLPSGDKFQQEHPNVKGDANLIESIISLWSQQAQIDERTKEFKLFARPILIQHQGQPTTSGTATSSKNSLHIASVWGVCDPTNADIDPDEFTVDVRTLQVTERRLQPQYIQLEREGDHLRDVPVLHYRQTEPSLTDEQLHMLTELLAPTKRLFYADQAIHWSLVDGSFMITRIETNASTAEPAHKVLLSGHCIQPGIVGGIARIIESPLDIPQITVGDIIVVSELTPPITQAFAQVAAIICDRDVSSPQLISLLKHQHIATIAHTQHATQTLRNGQRIIVDANAGKVYQAPTPMTQESIRHESHSSPTATKLYISAGNPDKAEEYLTSEVDGTGVLRSEYAYARFGAHPMHVIRSREKNRLKLALLQAIERYQTAQIHPTDGHGRSLPVIFRSLNFTSQELKALAQAETFEEEEANPYLGDRGAMKLLRNHELFDFELEVIQESLQRNQRPLGYMLPFVRTSGELQLIHHHLKDRRLYQFPHYSFWLQLNTPENLLNIDHYLLVPIDGFSINVRSIHALLHGIDPDNPELYSLYPVDIRLMERLLHNVLRAIHQVPHPQRGTRSHPEVVLHIEQNSAELVELAVRVGCSGVTVKPSFVTTTKQRLREAEAQQLKSEKY